MCHIKKPIKKIFATRQAQKVPLTIYMHLKITKTSIEKLRSFFFEKGRCKVEIIAFKNQ